MKLNSSHNLTVSEQRIKNVSLGQFYRVHNNVSTLGETFSRSLLEIIIFVDKTRPLKNWLDYRFYDFLVFQKKRGDKSSNFYIKFEQCPIIKALY